MSYLNFSIFKGQFCFNSVPDSPSPRQTSFFEFSNLFLSDPNSAEGTALEGQELYLHFVHEQLRSAQLGDLIAEEEARYPANNHNTA